MRLLRSGVAIVLLGSMATASLAGRVPEAAFADATEAAGLDFVHENGATGELYTPEIMGPGGALIDYDRDGDLDAYLIQGHRLGANTGEVVTSVDRLYRNDLHFPTGESAGESARGAVRFADVTVTAGLSPTAYGMGVATGDYDNDGWPDLYLANLGSNELRRNNGDGTFSDVTDEAGVDDPRWSVTAAFFDYDEDGWLDLWVVNFVDFTLDNAKTCVNPAGTVDYCAPAAYTPVTDSLFHNRGDGTFERVSSRAGIDREARPGLGAVAADFDNDGWLDLYVANDGMPNQLYLNNGDGTFREDALLAGCSVNSEGASEASMGTVAADFDNDGDEDLFLTHLTKETNTLYLNDGPRPAGGQRHRQLLCEWRQEQPQTAEPAVPQRRGEPVRGGRGERSRDRSREPRLTLRRHRQRRRYRRRDPQQRRARSTASQSGGGRQGLAGAASDRRASAAGRAGRQMRARSW